MLEKKNQQYFNKIIMRHYPTLTNHFLHRQWERKVDSYQLRKILDQIKFDLKHFSGFLLIGNSILKKAEIKANKTLILRLDNGKLITLFYERNLYPFLQKTKGQSIIL